MLDDIILFTELVEQKSFSKTANFLNISQSTISKRIANLEKKLNLNLLIHQTRSFELTRDGEVVYDKFKHLRQYLKENINLLHDKNDKFKKLLRISVPTSFGYDIICPYIHEFLEENPEINIELFFQHEYKDNFDTFDIIITHYPIKIHGHDSFPISYEVAHLFCTPRYKEKYGIPNHINELDNHRFLGIISSQTLIAPKTITFKHRYKKYEYVYDNSKTQLKSNLPAHLKKIGMNGDYIFGSWISTCQEELKKGELIIVLENYETYQTDFFISINQEYSLSEKKFIDFIRYCLNNSV